MIVLGSLEIKKEPVCQNRFFYLRSFLTFSSDIDEGENTTKTIMVSLTEKHLKIK